MTIDLALVVATSHEDMMRQASRHVADGFAPCGGPYVPPASFAVEMPGEPAGPPQVAWAFVRARQDIVLPVGAVPGVPGAGGRRL